MHYFKNLFFLLCLYTSHLHAGYTAEEILGEYWKDPLFGQAASETTVTVELLDNKLWPPVTKIDLNKIVRVIFKNNTNQEHLIVITEDLGKLLKSNSFQALIKDELHHASQKKSASSGHHHSHQTSDIDETVSIVKTIAENPTVFINAKDKKELLLRFTNLGVVTFACVIDGHKDTEIIGEFLVR